MPPSLEPVAGTTTAPEPANGNGALSKPWSSQAVDAWVGRFGGTAPKAMFTWLKPLVDRHGWEAVRGAWIRYLAEKDPQYANPKDFADKFAAWIDGPKARARPRTRPGMLDGEALLAMAEEMGKAAKSREEDGNAA